MVESPTARSLATGPEPGPRPGEWASPISPELVALTSGSVAWPSIVDDEVWWCAGDPRTAVVRLLRARPGADPAVVVDAPASVHNRALGYGGRPYLVLADGNDRILVHTDQRDQRLHRRRVPAPPAPAGPAEPLTPPDPPGRQTCYADPVPGPVPGTVLCVREVTWHRADGPHTERDLVAVPLDGSAATDQRAVRRVARSHHFLSGARVSPDGRRLCWIGWDHPAMPWDGTELMVAELAGGVAGPARVVLGGPAVSVPQAEWAGPDQLYAMADPDGWWTLHEVRLSGQRSAARCVLPMARECAGALWRIGPTWFAVTGAGVVLRHGDGAQRLAWYRPGRGELTDLAPDWTRFGADLAASDTAVAVVAAAEDRDSTVLWVPLPGSGQPDPVPVSRATAGDQRLRPWLSPARRRTATGPDGEPVHYLYHPPVNPAAGRPPGAAPPLLITVHGGPTSAAEARPDLELALFTSRGFAVANVDHGGSTGYGRAYRERLRHGWGVVDVRDCVTVARELARLGLADPARTAVRGGSAGGWTALACLGTTGVFCAGAVYYPITDPLTWSGPATHDFEACYLRSLVGELPADLDRYQAVSPLANAHRITSPVLLIQGADDAICRPDQAERVVAELARAGVPHRYLVFPGEGHGFRRVSSIAGALRAELELYARAMGLAVRLDPPEHG